MKYYLNLFSPETYEAFTQSDRNVSGFRIRQENVAQRVKPGDRFICYMTKLSRWVGVLDVKEGPYKDDAPIFYEEDDPFVVRFSVKPVVWLEKEKTVPIHEDRAWNTLTFTREHSKKTSSWTGKIRSSLNQLAPEDGAFLEKLIRSQDDGGEIFPLSEREYQNMVTRRVRRQDKTVSVSVPEDAQDDEDPQEANAQAEIRESIQIQALIAEIGAKMGMRIWIPRNDRSRVLAAMGEDAPPLLERLPLNYDDTTLDTIERIDVLWLKGRAIVRAFEVEHTTSIYSGILRMADLLALQPNMAINLHIVAPYERRDKVSSEIRRPVFSLLDRGPLAESCTYLSYESLREIAQEKLLGHLSDSVLDAFAEEAD